MLRRGREQEEICTLCRLCEIVRGDDARGKGNTRQEDRVRRIPIDHGCDLRLARPDDSCVAGTADHACQRGAERASPDYPHPRHLALPPYSTLVRQTREL
jgi:hypothetical protein